MSDGKVQVKFGEWIQQGWELYKSNIGVWIVASLLALVISAASLGILAGPMMAGLVWMALAMVEQKELKPQVGDVFRGFDYFLQSFLFCLVWGVIVMAASLLLNLIICVGAFIAIALSLAVQTGLMFGLFLIVDQKIQFWPASMQSFALVKPNFFPLLGLYLVASIISSLGAIACGIGVIVTMPLLYCILAVAYRNVVGAQQTA